MNTAIATQKSQVFRIAIVDDHDDSRLLLRIHLEDHFLISDFASVREFLACDETFHLVLTDISMPEMDGFDLLSNIQARQGLLNIPVIATTANAGDSIKRRALTAGFREFVCKPFDLDDLYRIIKQHLPETAM